MMDSKRHWQIRGESPRILIIKRSSLGDIVHALPALNAIRDRYPHSYIAWVVETRFLSILQGHPALDELIPVERHRFPDIAAVIREAQRVARELHKRDFDWALDLQGLLKSSILLRMSGARRRVVFADERRDFTYLMGNDRAPGDKYARAVNRYLQMAAHLDCDISRPRFDLPVAPQARDWATTTLTEAGIDGSRPVVGLNPGASLPFKQWPVARYAELAGRHPEIDWIVIGGPGEENAAHEIARGAFGRYVVTAGKTNIPQLVGIIDRMDALVTVDTGPMHIAAALKVPTVALFGPTRADLTGPYGDFHRVIWHPEFNDRRDHRRDRKATPSMLAISVEEVESALNELIQRA